ncbi:PilZ domain-containing protein [Vibrio genomosp. F6]|uniref:PilZ domain-containing protein n=1 Tax=Vibrio TaxID=662 RepID=UPI0010BD8BE5|nr:MULTISPECIES: PilZ domain-containing protein [Vibrio]MDN3698950.1 PilZ domain-containing protein [Vibrio cortegadensis]NOH82974.1 PilZ domain-containing protein [Vibrio sp. 03-59-1]TKF20604.1 PilZ domain-containing protein [Vibrio genomosp. F6]
MQQSEILSLTERLISTYHADDFDYVLSQVTNGEPPSVKLLVKMELNRIMAPCSKKIDLRGKVQGECREYELDGIQHWLDDVAFNAYHKNTRRFGSYTEGVWEALNNTKNNFRVLNQQPNAKQSKSITNPDSPYEAEPIHLGYSLKRQENRLKVFSQVKIELPKSQVIHGLSVDLSGSGARFKVPSAFDYNLGQEIAVTFTELMKQSEVVGIDKPIVYRILGIDDSHENDAIKFLRTMRLTETDIVNQVITESLTSNSKKTRHDNQDKIIQARTRGYEHAYLKHTGNLPLFFSGSELKLALLTDNNQPLWQYWHDERNQQAFGTLFNSERMDLLTRPGLKGSSNVIYSFTHTHQNKTLFYSMMLPEASREQRQLFWHIGAKRPSWKAFRLSIFELSEEESQSLAQHSTELNDSSQGLTHCGILQEIGNEQSSSDYLLTERPRLASNELNQFRHSRQILGQPKAIFFDAQGRRKEPRYQFKSPVEITTSDALPFTGHSIDISKHGISLILDTAAPLKAGDSLSVNLKELQLYDKSLPLGEVPYQVIRISPNARCVQLAIENTSRTTKTIAFFNSIIEHNKDKLKEVHELLASNSLLESLHNSLLNKIVSSPIFIDKHDSNLRTKVIGVNYPLPNHLVLLAKLGHEECLSLEPIFKGRSNSLLATPLKRIEGAELQYHEVYIAAIKFGGKLQSIHTKLSDDFKHARERIDFIKKAKEMGEVYVLRISGAPVFNSTTSLLQYDIDELTQVSIHDAGKLDKEIRSIIGYGEIVDITEEVMIRLELT